MALKFAPFRSEIELPFYTALSQSKIDHDKLDDSARRVLGLYEPKPNTAPDQSCCMQVLGNALTSEEYVLSRDSLKASEFINANILAVSSQDASALRAKLRM